MKERPILFSAPMVRALLDGSKTQTRRIAKGVATVHSITGEPLAGCDSEGPRVQCPFGQPGDLLWVRETHAFDPPDDGSWNYTQWSGCAPSPWREIPKRFWNPEHVIHAASWAGSEITWRPSIHMPRWASRITLRITDVRVERLQDISGDDCIAEGAWPIEQKELGRSHEAVDAFRDLWNSINGAGSWDANPWVWVVEFDRVATVQNGGEQS